MNKKHALINLILCSILHGFNHYILIFYKPIYPTISGYFHLNTVAEITTRMTIIYAGYAISNFLTGILAKRISLKQFLFCGMLLMSVATTLIYFVPSNMYFMMVILVFIMGLGGGTYHPAANTLITSSYEGKAGHAIGLLSVGSACGLLLAPFIGEYLGGTVFGFKILFLISGLLGILFSLVFLIFTKDFKLITAETNPDIKINAINSPPISKGKVLAIAIALLCIPVTIREIISWGFYEITPFWVKYGFSCGLNISLVQSMQYLPGVLVQPFTGKLCDYFGTKKVLIITFAMLGLGLMLFSISNLFILWLAMILYGIGMSASTVSSETYMAQLALSKDRALVYGILLSIGIGCGGLLAGASGLIIDAFRKEVVTGYQTWYLLSGSLLILSLFIYSVIEKLKRKSNNEISRMAYKITDSN